ncbi:MAG: hypothetical protein D3924_01415 [Candidatus Electrothrix sp. AR4]|nr:hypothetical protein [Candidatus Electrothrix sp. AR4]
MSLSLPLISRKVAQHFGTALLLACVCSAQAYAELTTVWSGMYNKKPFVNKQYVFSPYDTFYYVLDVEGLEPGKHTMHVDWKKPSGALEQQTEYSFIFDRKLGSQRIYSWLQLWRNGPLKRLLTGQDFKIQSHGLWVAIVYIDGNFLTKQEFEVL